MKCAGGDLNPNYSGDITRRAYIFLALIIFDSILNLSLLNNYLRFLLCDRAFIQVGLT